MSRPETELEHAIRTCTDPAVLAASPEDQRLYHLLMLNSQYSSVAFVRAQRMGARLRARYVPDAEEQW